MRICYKNGVPISDHPVFVHHADFVSCYKGRSYTLVEEETVIISDTESVVAVPPRHTGGVSGSNGHCLHGWSGAGSIAAAGPAV